MADAITIKALQDASLDAKSLEEVVNGNESKQVTTRKGENYPSVKKAIKTLFENGGLPATPFKTKALMTASSLADGKYAMVTDDTVAANNGLYIKDSGVWTLSKYGGEAMVQAVEKLGSSERYVTPTELQATTLQGVSISTASRAISTAETNAINYLFDVNEGETLTFYQARVGDKSNNRPRLLFFKEAPNDWLTYNVGDVYMAYGNGLQLEDVTDVVGGGLYFTVTVPSEMTKVVWDTRVYDRDFLEGANNTPAYAVIKGEFDEDILRSLESFSVFENRIRAREIDADTISSPSLKDNKNLFRAYSFGGGTTRNLDINEQGTVRVAVVDFGRPNYFNVVCSYLYNVKPNTTYTVTKEPSDRFSLAISDDKYQGKILVRDSSVQEFTFTTESDTTRIFMELSASGEKPLVQVEEGSTATLHSYYKSEIKDRSTPKIGLLSEPQPVTDGGYMDLQIKTDKFMYPVGNVTYTESSYIDEYYEPLLAQFPHQITKEVVGKDASGEYDIVKYVFEPDEYEQTLFVTSGIHPTEAIPPFALGAILREIYVNPQRHPMLAYMRNHVRFIVMPTLNPWGMNVVNKVQPANYFNSNGVNLNRQSPNRWYQYNSQGAYDKKGSSPLSEAEAMVLKEQFELYADSVDAALDLHTGEGWTADTFIYWREDDKYLKPALANVVSMRNELIRRTKGREPVNVVYESNGGLFNYFVSRTLGIPRVSVEYAPVGTAKLSGVHMHDYTNLLFNYFSYTLKARIGERKKQDKLIEHSKPYISLFNFLDGQNEFVDEYLPLDDIIASSMESLGLTKQPIVDNAESDIVKLVYEPDGYDDTIVIMAGARGKSRKDVTSLFFTAYKFLTDDNPYIKAMRLTKRIVFIPCLNPVGYANKSDNNLNGINPHFSFADSQEPEAVDLRVFLADSEISHIVQIDSRASKAMPSFKDLHVISNTPTKNKLYDVIEGLQQKYGREVDYAVLSAEGSEKPTLSEYILELGVAYSYVYVSQYTFPKNTPPKSTHIDYGYEPDEMAFCSEVVLNAIRAASIL